MGNQKNWSNHALVNVLENAMARYHTHRIRQCHLWTVRRIFDYLLFRFTISTTELLFKHYFNNIGIFRENAMNVIILLVNSQHWKPEKLFQSEAASSVLTTYKYRKMKITRDPPSNWGPQNELYIVHSSVKLVT